MAGGWSLPALMCGDGGHRVRGLRAPGSWSSHSLHERLALWQLLVAPTRPRAGYKSALATPCAVGINSHMHLLTCLRRGGSLVIRGASRRGLRARLGHAEGTQCGARTARGTVLWVPRHVHFATGVHTHLGSGLGMGWRASPSRGVQASEELRRGSGRP